MGFREPILDVSQLIETIDMITSLQFKSFLLAGLPAKIFGKMHALWFPAARQFHNQQLEMVGHHRC